MIGFMNIHRTFILTIALAASSAFAQTPTPAAAISPAASATTSPAATTSTTTAPAQPSADMQEMMKVMMEMGKVGENHKLLAEMAGSWTYTAKMYMDPAGQPQESKGTATRKAIMEGRYFMAEHTGKFKMPGPDGKMQEMNFKGMAFEGYDNAKKKFVSAWIDNMSTMILNSEGTYDAATKTFTYNAECEMMPGKMTRIREVIKVVDKDHHTFEWYDNSRGPETKTMEISYTRAGKK